MPSIPAQEHPCPRCARLELDHRAVVERLRSERDHRRRLHSEERTQRQLSEVTTAGLVEDMANLKDWLSELSRKIFARPMHLEGSLLSCLSEYRAGLGAGAKSGPGMCGSTAQCHPADTH